MAPVDYRRSEKCAQVFTKMRTSFPEELRAQTACLKVTHNLLLK